MIRRKLDMRNIITSLNEVEKLKMLLFDEDQYYLFEHIPKPVLYDRSIVEPEIWENNDPKKIRVEKERLDCILTNNTKFWSRKEEKDKERDFAQALKNIRQKDSLTLIDHRLIQIIDRIVEE